MRYFLFRSLQIPGFILIAKGNITILNSFINETVLSTNFLYILKEVRCKIYYCIIYRVFNDVNHQNLAFNAARKAFDITSNHALFPPNFPFSDDGPDFRGFGRLPGFNMNNMFGYGNMPGYSAFASGVASPDYAHQVASINPQNPNIPNVNVMNRFGETAPNDGQPHYIGVSSTSYSSSSNLNGKEYNQRGAQTVVNKDGKITSYKVQN